MASESRIVSSIEAEVNHTSPNIADIDDDPDSPDGNWMTWDGNGNTDLRCGFDTPTGNPTGGADVQEFRILVRKTSSGGNDPVYDVELWDNAAGVPVLAQTLVTGATLTDSDLDPGTVISHTFDHDNVAAIDGSDCELRVVQTSGGTGNPGSRRGLEVGAAEWIVEYSAVEAVIPIINQAPRHRYR